MSNEEEIKQRYERIAGELTERTRRLYAANEALSLGWGGISAVSRATGLSRQVISDGIQELQGGKRAEEGRVRAMVRSRSKAGVIEGLPGVEIVEGDLRDADAIARALDGVERALLLSSSDPSLIELQHNFIAVAKRSK